MANNVLDKEQLNTKEMSDNIALNSNVDTINTELLEDNINLSSADKKSYIGRRFVDNIPTNENISFTQKYFLLICITVGIILFFCIFSTIFALINIGNNKIIEGVSINGISVSGLTSEAATQKLTDAFSKKLNSTLTLKYQDYNSEIIPAQDINANYDVSAAVQKAYSIGRSGNLIQNNYEILTSIVASKKVSVNLNYDSDKLNQYLNDISVELPGIVIQPSYYIENENLIIVNGTSGIELVQDKSKELIISNLETLSSSSSIELPIQNIEPNQIDIDKIHDEIHTEPQNAYIIQEPFELNVGSSGTDFAVTIDEAKNLLNEPKEEYIIPLKITPPQVGVEDLGNDIFVHTLGSYSSTFNVYNYNRTTNVNIATQKINNVILLPGETFSYNKVVGERTFENGFKEASVYTSSGVVNGLGGGICQVSSTLYNAVLEANLEIVERRNHRYAVSYVPLGRDATVAYGSIDFRFKNNRAYPIKVIANTQNGTLYVYIKGIEEEVEYDVSITTKRLQTIPYTTKYIEDSSMDVGTQKQTQYGDNGYKYETYKTVSLNGNVVSSELISTDNYTPLTRVIRVGIKQAQVTAPPVETPPVETPPVHTQPEDNTDSGSSDAEIPNNNTNSGTTDIETPTDDNTNSDLSNNDSNSTNT